MNKKTKRKIAWLIILLLLLGMLIPRFLKNKKQHISIEQPISFEEIENLKYKQKFLGGEKKAKDKIAVIKIMGEIIESEGGYYRRNLVEDIISQLNQAKNDQDVKCIILRISSPGGTVVAAEKLYEKLLEVKKEKKIVSLLEGIATSGAYYIAVTGDKIVAYPSTITGSIGAIFTLPNSQKLMEDKLGIKMITIKSGKYKDIGSPFRSMSKTERKILQDIINSASREFLNIVTSNRKIPESKLPIISDARIFSAEEAQKIGLIDEIGSMNKAIEIAKEIAKLKEAKVMEYYYKPTIFDFLLSSHVKKISLNNIPKLPETGLKYIWLPGENLYGE